MTPVAGGVEGDGEAASVRMDIGCGDGGVGDRDARRLVRHQQGVDFCSIPAGVRVRSTRPSRMETSVRRRRSQCATRDAPEGTPVSRVPPSHGPILAVEALRRLVELIDRLCVPARRAGAGPDARTRRAPQCPVWLMLPPDGDRGRLRWS